jgi:hypothetical protein
MQGRQRLSLLGPRSMDAVLTSLTYPPPKYVIAQGEQTWSSPSRGRPPEEHIMSFAFVYRTPREAPPPRGSSYWA